MQNKVWLLLHPTPKVYVLKSTLNLVSVRPYGEVGVMETAFRTGITMFTEQALKSSLVQWCFHCHRRKGTKIQAFFILLSGILPLTFHPLAQILVLHTTPSRWSQGLRKVLCTMPEPRQFGASQNYSNFSSELRFCPGRQLQKTTKRVLCLMLQS